MNLKATIHVGAEFTATFEMSDGSPGQVAIRFDSDNHPCVTHCVPLDELSKVVASFKALHEVKP